MKLKLGIPARRTMPVPSPMRVAHSHYRATRKNRGHILRVSRDSPATLQTGKRTGKSDSLLSRAWSILDYTGLATLYLTLR
jgi:hypothetical protein